MRTSRLAQMSVLAIAFGAASLQAQIASDRLEIRGLSLTVETVAVTTAVDVQTTIQTAFGGKTGDQALAVPGLLAVGELIGPGIETPIRLTTVPGGRFRIPGLSRQGAYSLRNIRLMHGDDVLRPATPSVATITVADLVQATLKVRQLTPEEIRSRGIVVDARNYEVYEYTFSFLVNGQTVEVPFPVIVDPRTHVVTPVVAEKTYTIPTPKNVEPPRWAPPDVIPFEFPEDPEPFDPTEPVLDFDKAVARRRPPIPAALVIPNSFSVLHQFFAVALTVSNGAPDGSTARLEDVSATLRIKNPLALRTVKSQPAVAFGQAVPLVDATTGVTVLVAQAKAEAEWTLEGLKPGTHTVEVDLRATFKEEGQEAVPLRALPTASIVIHDPRFNITFSHPATVREGLDYSTFAFITNMSPVAQTIRVTDGLPECVAGQKVNVCRVSGATIGDLTLASGEMRMVEYKLRSGTTGKVFATAGSIEGENLSASVELHMGVSESGIALSPATLILPHYAQYAPPDLVSAYLQLLGLGYSVATAPVNQVTASLPRVIKTDVFHRANDVARAGQRIFITNGSLDGRRDALANLTLDLLGNGVMLREWDELRRRESEKSGRLAGAAVVGALMSVSTEGRTTMAELVDGFASRTAHRGDFVLALVHSASGTTEARPLHLSLRSAAGRITSAANEADAGWKREIAFADLSRADAFGRFGELAVVGRWIEDLELVITPAVSGSYDVEVLFPGSTEQTMLRAHLTGSGTAGETLRVPLTRGATSINAILPNGGFAATAGTTAVIAPPLQIAGARQDLHLDPAAHKVSLLFNRPVSIAAGADLLTKFSGAVKLDRDGILFEGPRPIFAAGLQEDGRVVNLSFDHALSTNASYTISVGPLVDPLTGSEARLEGAIAPKVDNDRPAGILYGKFLTGDNKPIAGGEIKLYSGHYVGCASEHAGPGEGGVACNPYREMGQYAETRDDGSFLFEAIVRDPEVDRELTGSYRAVGVTADGRYTLVDGSVRLPGKVHVLNLQLLGRGAAEGVVRYDDGAKVSGARVYVGSTMFNIGRETATDASGFFRVEDLPVGPVTFSATDAAGNVAWGAGEISTPGQVAVKDLLIYRKPFPGTGTVYGTVRRSDTGDPVFGARVGVCTQGYGFSDAMTDSDGRFEFRKVPSGFVTVLAAEWSVSRESAASDFDLRPDEAKEVNLILAVAPPATALVTLEGDVVRENALDATIKEPVAGAIVKLGLLTATTDTAGHFRIEALPILLSGRGLSVKAYDPATKRFGEAALPTLSESASNYLKILIPANSYGTGTIRVRVLDAQGLPVAGMRVIEPGYPPKRVDEVGGGLYEWKDAPVGAPRTFFAVNAPAKYGDQFANGRIGLQFPGQTATLVLRLPGQGTVRARLRGDIDLIGPVTLTYDAWDELEQGPYRKVRDGSTSESGVAGWATFTAVPAVTRFRLESAHPSYGYAAASGTLGYEGDLAEHTLQMSKLASIRGVVYAIDGVTPIASAAVRLHDGARDTGTVYTQPDGSFAFGDVPAGVSFTVSADVVQEGIYRVGMATGRTPDTGGPAANVSVILRRRGSVEGRVVYAAYKTFDPENPANNVADDTPNDLSDNAPAPLAKFWLRELEFPGRTFGTAGVPLTADIGGRFALSSVFVGSLRARAWDATNQELRGDWTGTLTFEGETLTGPAAYIAIGSGGAGTVQVTVANPNQQNAPVANAEVQLFRGGSLFDTTSTDGAGLARFEQVPVGTYSIGVYSKSLGKSGSSNSFPVTQDQQADLRVLLEFVGMVDGKLSDPESTPPDKGLPGVPVLMRGSNYTTQASTDPTGLFFFEGVREGRFDLSAKDAGSNRRAFATGLLTPENRRPFVNLELERTFALHVAVYLPDDIGGNSGQLAGPFEIDVQQRNGQYHRTLQGNLLEFSGLFISDGYSIVLRELGGAGRTLHASGKHPAGTASQPVKIVYPAFGDLAVTVTQGGVLAAGVRVDVSGGGYSATLYTDSTGKVLTHGVPLNVPISVQARSIDERFSGSTSATVLRQSVPATAGIDLGEYAAIIGLVEAEGGGPSIGTRVTVSFSGRTLEVPTDGDGRYRFDGIPTSAGGTTVALNYVGPDGVTAGGSQSVVLTNADASKMRTLPTIRLDATPPQLLSVIPADGAASVSPDSFVRLAFSEVIQQGLIGNGNLQLIAADGTGQVQCAFEQVVNADGTYGVTMRPPAPPAGQRFPLKSNTLYRILVKDTIADLSGHRLSGTRGFLFTTADYAEPRVVKVEPAVSSPVPAQVTFAFHFNEAIDPAPWAQGAGARFHFYKLSSAGVAGQVVAEKPGHAYVDPATAMVLYFAPTEPIEPEAFYRVVFNGVRDLQGNALGEEVFHFFAFDATAPFVRIVSPVPEGTNLVSGVEYTLTPDVRNGTAEGTPANDVASIEYSRIDGAAETFLTKITAAPFSYRFVAPDGSPEGTTLTLRAKAFDKSGNVSQPATASWTVKPNAAPSSIAVKLTPASAYPGNGVSAEVTFTDEGTVATLQVVARGTRSDGSEHTESKSTQVNRPSIAAAWPAATFAFALPPTLKAQSSMTFTVDVTDVRGLKGSATAELPLLADGVAPVIHSVKPDPETTFKLNSTYQVEAVVSDAETAVAEVSFLIDDRTYDVTTSAAGPIAGTRKFVSPTITVPAKNVDTRVAIVVTAKDHQGNATSRTIEIVYLGVNDPTVPRAAWLCPIDRGALPAAQSGFTLPLRVRASDDIAITSVKFNVPGIAEPLIAQRVGTTDEYEATGTVTTPASGSPFTITAVVNDADPAHVVELPIALEIVAVDRIIDATEAIDADNLTQYQNRSLAVRGAGAKLVANVPVTLQNLLVLSGARVEALPTTTTVERRIDLTVAETLYVDCTSTIDMTARGYLGGWQENAGGSGTRNEDARGRTVGNALTGGASGTSASHAGVGGVIGTNETYGSITEPAALGSGGAGATACCTAGAAGGGAIAIRSNGRITIAGTIAANGGSGVDRGGAGAGGSIRLSADHVVAGPRAHITANGGDDNGAAGGGGGRIAIRATTRLTFEDGTIQARGGRHANGAETRAVVDGGAGTIYLMPPGQTAGELLVSAADDRFVSTQHLTRPTPVATALVLDGIMVGPRALVRLDSALTVPKEATVIDETAVVVGPTDVPALTIIPTPAAGATLPRASSLSINFTVGSTAGVEKVTFLWPAGADRTEPVPLYPTSFNSAQPVMLPVATDAPVGAVSLIARVADRAGRTFEATPVQYTVAENTAPVVASLGVTPASLYPGRTVTATLSASDDVAVTKVTATATIGTTATSIVRQPKTKSVTNETFLFEVPQTTPGATPMRIEIAIEDGYPGRDAVRQTASVTIEKDTVAPQVSILEPAADQLFDERSGAMFLLRATATDAQVAVKTVTAKVGEAAPVTMTFANNEWRATLPVPNVDGTDIVSIPVVVTAVDFEGNGANAPFDIRVRPLNDPNGPKASWTCGTDGAMYPAGYAAKFRVAASGATPANGVQKVEIAVDGGTPVLATPVSGVTGQYEVSLTIPDLQDGATIVVRAVATSVAGNQNEIASRVTVVRTDVPAIAADLTIDDTNATTYENKTVIVQSGTVTVMGARTFHRLVLLGGSLTHASGGGNQLQLSITGAIHVACGAALDASGRGYGLGATYPNERASTLISAGSHIGRGGQYSGQSGATFGSVYRPQEAGGGANHQGYPTGGGGVIRLEAASVVVDGAIRANGMTSMAAAGGSVWLQTERIRGSGTVEANGSSGGWNTGGGGAVAIEYTDATSILPSLRAMTEPATNNPGKRGAAGSVYVRGPASVFGEVIFDSAGTDAQTAIELPSLGRGIALTGTAGNVLMTDRVSDVPAYFVGHRVEITDANGEAKGTWRVASIDATNKKALTLAATGNETIELSVGARWRGVYLFDATTVRRATLTTLDSFRSTAPVVLESGGQLLLNDAAPTVDAGRISLSSHLSGDVIIGTAGAVSDPEGPVKVTAKSSAGVSFTGIAAADGSFVLPVDGPIGETFTLTATDSNPMPLTSAAVPIAGQIANVNGVASLTILPQTTTADDGVTGTIRLLAPARTGGGSAVLTSSDATVVVPASVTIPAGKSSASFVVATTSPTVVIRATVTAALGVRSASATLNLLPAASVLASITINPSTATTGASVIGAATLAAPAQAGGATIVLSSSNTTVATVPTTVVIAEGQLSAEFTITTLQAGSVAVTGTYGATRMAVLTIEPCNSMTFATKPSSIGLVTTWLDDSLPSGATVGGVGTFTTAQAASGAKSVVIPEGAGSKMWSFSGAAPLTVAAGDLLVVHVLVNPCKPPRQVLFAWGEGTSEYRASWGEDLIDPTVAHTRVASMPTGGVWTRLEVRAATIGASSKSLKALTVKVYDGELWLDGIGTAGCALLSDLPPPTSFSPADEVWLEDATPTGATVNVPWTWDSSQKASGARSHVQQGSNGFQQHWYNDAKPIAINPGDVLVAYVLLDPCNPPREILLAWNDGSTWDHRAYWGEDLINYPRHRVGPLPQTGAWVRLEVPGALVGLNGRSVTGVAFELYGGRVWFDRTGKASRVNLALNKPARQSSDLNVYDTAAKAVDGEAGYTRGNSNSVMSSTGAQPDPWWEVDLGSVLPIESIEIRGRNDCCQQESGNLYVLVSDDAITATDLTAARARAAISTFHSPGNAGSVQSIEVRRTGRFIRIWRGATDVLSLAEVMVWSPVTASRTNLAGGRSSVVATVASNYLAEYAVNGSQSDALSSVASGFQSQATADSYWQVDLGASHAISSIDISSRTDGHPEQLTNYYVLTSDQPFTAADFAAAHQQSVAGGSVWYQSMFRPMQQIQLNRTARYVRLQRGTGMTSVLAFTEVQVWSQAKSVLALSRPSAPQPVISNATGSAAEAAEPKVAPETPAVRNPLITNRP